MKKTDIKNIIFDFGGVIMDLHIQRVMDEFLALGGSKDLFPKQYSQFEGIFQLIDRGEMPIPQFYDAVREQGHIPHATNEQIRNAWLSLLGPIQDKRFRALSKLKERYSLYILSNANAIHWDYIESTLMRYHGEDVNKWFRRIFLSYEMHLEKPEPEIYQTVVREAGIIPQQTLFIDDSELNTSAAAALGFHVLHSINGDWVPTLKSWVSEPDNEAGKLHNSL